MGLYLVQCIDSGRLKAEWGHSRIPHMLSNAYQNEGVRWVRIAGYCTGKKKELIDLYENFAKGLAVGEWIESDELNHHPIIEWMWARAAKDYGR